VAKPERAKGPDSGTPFTPPFFLNPPGYSVEVCASSSRAH
jgi:hypothetical protein